MATKGAPRRFDHARIAAVYMRGTMLQREVAQEFGCSTKTVVRAVREFRKRNEGKRAEVRR